MLQICLLFFIRFGSVYVLGWIVLRVALYLPIVFVSLATLFTYYSICLCFFSCLTIPIRILLSMSIVIDIYRIVCVCVCFIFIVGAMSCVMVSIDMRCLVVDGYQWRHLHE